MAKLSPVRVDPVVSTNPALTSEAVEILANAQVNGTQSREKRPRRVEVACTCGHGTTRGRHKRGCAKTAPALKSEDGVRQPTMLEKLLSQRSVSDIHNQAHTPEKLEKMLARGTMSQRVDHHIADDEEVERILFPDNEEVVGLEVRVVFVAKEEPLWGCFHPRQMISTRTIAALLAQLSDIFPDDSLLDPLAFRVLLSGKGHQPRLLGMKFCVIAHHHQHYVAFGYCPFRKRQVSYDCELNYFDNDRKGLFRQFAVWLEDGGNEIDHTHSNKANLQEPLSNNCALHAVNNVIHFLCGQYGVLDRDELRKKHLNPRHCFRWLAEDPTAPLFRVSHTPCDDCGTKLRQMESKTGQMFWGCPNLICRTEKRSVWRKAWDL